MVTPCLYINHTQPIERFSFECRKVIGFAFTTLHNCFKKLAPLFHPIRSKTKTNRDSLVRVFPRFASTTCNNFVFWLVHLIICVLCDWLEWLLWFWFYDTQLKTALIPWLTPDKGLTLETSAFESHYGGQFSIFNPVDKTNLTCQLKKAHSELRGARTRWSFPCWGIWLWITPEHLQNVEHALNVT